MIEGLVSQIMQRFLYKYLQNFDENNLNISLLRGRIDLTDLQLNDNILKNIPVPVNLKYGRIGSIHIELPSLFQLAHPKIKITISDIFICLTIKEMKDWDKEVILREYQEDKKDTLQQQEDDSKYIFEEYKGDDDKMNKYLLQLIQNIQVDIKRIYLRVEDPYQQFAMGVLLPSINIETTDKDWNIIDLVKGDPEIMHKIIQVNEFQIFMECDNERSQIDSLMNLDEIRESQDFDLLLEHRIKRHIEYVFSEEFESTFILHKFYLDIRFQFILDKIRALENNAEYNEPDIKLEILFGDLFENYEKEDTKTNWMRIRLFESQIHKLVRFTTFTGLYNTYRLGVLRPIFEKPLNVKSDEIQDYLKLYAEYLKQKQDNNKEKMEELREQLFEIEEGYRIDLLYMLRKLEQERFYGLQKADHYRQERLKSLEGIADKIKSGGILSKIPFFGKKEEEVQENNHNSQERTSQLKTTDLGYKIIKHMYYNRYKNGLEDLDKLSKLRHDPYFTFQQNKLNTTMVLEFQMPKSQFEVFQDLSGDKNEQRDYTLAPVFDCVVEGLEITMISETKPQYLGIQLTLDNIYVYDHHCKTKQLPFVIQTIIGENLSQVRNMQAIEIFYEKNPKSSKVASHRLKIHNLGQLYIYSNLDFATTSLRIWTRLIAEMNNAFAQMIESAEPKIQQDINKGSFYQQLLQQAVSEKQEQFYDILERITHGSYDPPSLDLDIKMISPKIIIYEKLLNQNRTIEENPVAIILDLGTIQADTQLIKKMKDENYAENQNIDVLFDKITVRFGKMKLYVDYNLHILHNLKYKFTCDENFQSNQFERQNMQIGGYKSQLQVNNKCTNWQPSSRHQVSIFDNVNFGFEISTCMVPFHKVYPSQILNFKFSKFELNVSRKVLQSLLLVYNITWQGKFMKQFNLFCSQPPPRPPVIRDENGNIITREQLKQQEMTTEEKERELQNQILNKKIAYRHDENEDEEVSLLVYLKRLLFDQTIEDVKQKYKSKTYDEAKKAVTIRLNFVFQQMSVNYQDINVIINQPYNPNEGVTIKDIFEFQVSNIYGQMDFIPKERINFVFILGQLLITYKDPDQDTQYFKHFILNPQDQQVESDRNLYRCYSEMSPSKYRIQHISDFSKVNPMNLDNLIDFSEFKQFSLIVDYKHGKRADLSRNQLSVEYEEIYDDNQMEILLGNIRVVFIVPLIYSMFKAYADTMIDMYKIDHLVKEHMAQQDEQQRRGRNYNINKIFQTQRTNTSIGYKYVSQSTAINEQDQRFGSKENSTKQKSFILDKAYQNENQELEQKNVGKQKPAGTMARTATMLLKFQHDPRDSVPIEPSPKIFENENNDNDEEHKKELKFKQRTVRSYVVFKSRLMEVVIPSNLHERDSLCLRMCLKLDADMSRRTLFQDSYLPDKWETWVQSKVLNDASHIQTSINQLAIFMENQGQKLIEQNHELMSQFTPLFRERYQNQNKVNNKIYLLHPYNLHITIKSYTEIIKTDEAYSKIHFSYKSDDVLNLTAGLCELNSYLLLGQLCFSLLNEIMSLNNEINETNKHFNLAQKTEVEIQKDKVDIQRNIEETQQIDNRKLNLEEILRNENLLQNSKQSTKNRWKRATKLAIASTRRKDFYELINDFDIKGVHMHFVDNLTSQNLALISFYIGLQNVHVESRGFDVPSVYRMEHLFQIEKIKEQRDLLYFKMHADLTLKALYFNRSNYYEEPFIEEFPFSLVWKQRTPLSKSKQIIQSPKMLNINITYGIACNLQRIIRTILDMEAEIKNIQEKQQQEQALFGDVQELKQISHQRRKKLDENYQCG